MLLSVCSPLLDVMRPVFTRHRTYQLVCGILLGMILSTGDTTMTAVYLALGNVFPDAFQRYWSLEQVLRRRTWNVEDLMAAFAEFLLRLFPDGYFIADVTHTTTQGKHQAARGFRKNPHYRKGYQNQSKYLAGNDILSVAFISREAHQSGIRSWCFALGGVLVRMANKKFNEQATLVRTIERVVPKGKTVLYDRGGNAAATVNRLGKNYRYITRLNANAVFYADATCRTKLAIKDHAVVAGKRKRENVYRSRHICYRRGVKFPILVVAEWFYNRSKRRWRVVYYLCTDTTATAEEVIAAYTLRRQIETTHSDSKLFAGFEDCRVRSADSIEAWCSLSLMAIGMLEYLRWNLTHTETPDRHLDSILHTLRMHWYHPKQLTRGLVCCFFRHCLLAGKNEAESFGAYFFSNNGSTPLSSTHGRE